MNTEEAEQQLGIKFPKEHVQALLDLSDPIHKACDFLLLNKTELLETVVAQNAFLHSNQCSELWPSYLVAFASNGCGHYFTYDLRSVPYSIIYMDPDRSLEENLNSLDKLTFINFETWCRDQIKTSNEVRNQLIQDGIHPPK